MALPLTYFRRKKIREKGDAVDVYQYEQMSTGLRTQILMLMEEMEEIQFQNFQSLQIYDLINPVIRKDKKVFKLADGGYNLSTQRRAEFRNWFAAESNLDFLLTGLELFMRLTSTLKVWRSDLENERNHIIECINAVMMEDCFGFQFEGGDIIEVGSTYIHKNVVVPALGILSEEKYSTVNSEFRKAHSEFRGANYEDCIRDCCNSFESLMKIIAKENGWSEITDKSTVKDLVKSIFDHKYIPDYMAQEFTGLRTILEGGINTVRNKAGGHGQGAKPRVIDKQVAEFQLNQTAAALRLLAEYNK